MGGASVAVSLGIPVYPFLWRLLASGSEAGVFPFPRYAAASGGKRRCRAGLSDLAVSSAPAAGALLLSEQSVY